ncbi:hypothetical protein HYV84_02345 [Candidatus Woesearchaeota archaeon]|nr:hypothetical protein [Candidatus Woesearchaeota archaeon]
MKAMRNVMVLMILVLSIIAGGSAYAQLFDDDVGVLKFNVEVNDVLLDATDAKELEKTDELDVLVVFKLNKSVDDVQIVAELTGYDKNDRQKVRDETDKFDVSANIVHDERLTLELPVRFQQGEYSLKIRVETPKDSFTFLFPVVINAQEHDLEIRDIVLSPENEVKAGRSLLTSVRIKNRGEQREEDVKVKVSIPALGVTASDFIDELDEEDCNDSDCDDSTTSEEIFLRIPDCAEPGEYTVNVGVEFDDGDDEVTESTKIAVLEGDTCPSDAAPAKGEPAKGKTQITIGPESQDIAAGSSGNYPVSITNGGTSSKTYTISADASWAASAVSPDNVVVVGPDETKAVFVSLTPNKGVSGSQAFSVRVKGSGDAVLKEVPLKANVVAASSTLGKVKKAIEVGVVVLVVLLVILALIIAFNKLRGDEGSEEKGDQGYY